MFLTKPMGSWKCRITAVSVLGIETSHHAQTPAVLDHSRTLPQGDGGTGPAFAGGAESGERNLEILDAGDVLDDAFPVRGPGIDAEGEMRSHRRGSGSGGGGAGGLGGRGFGFCVIYGSSVSPLKFHRGPKSGLYSTVVASPLCKSLTTRALCGCLRLRRSAASMANVFMSRYVRGSIERCLALLWQIYSCRCSLQIHFRQCGHRRGGSRATSSRMAWRTAGRVGWGGGPLILFFPPCCC